MANHKRLELKGVERHSQGSHDGLCVYYSACTVLATLVPASREVLGNGERVRKAGFKTKDPLLLSAAKAEVNATMATKVAVGLANWFFNGARLQKVISHMNKLAKDVGGAAKAFDYLGAGKHAETKRQRVIECLDEGLPLMMAWDSRVYGDHCVAVTGYRTDGKTAWFSLDDPGGDGQISWDELCRHCTGVELILPRPEAFMGLRPDKQTWEEKPNGSIKPGSRREWRWWPDASGQADWHDLGSLFEAASSPKK